MVKLEKTDKLLKVILSTKEHITTLSSDLAFAVSDVVSITEVDSVDLNDYIGILSKRAGLYVADIIARGTFKDDNDYKNFIYSKQGAPATIVTLAPQSLYHYVIVEKQEH